MCLVDHRRTVGVEATHESYSFYTKRLRLFSEKNLSWIQQLIWCYYRQLVQCPTKRWCFTVVKTFHQHSCLSSSETESYLCTMTGWRWGRLSLTFHSAVLCLQSWDRRHLHMQQWRIVERIRTLYDVTWALCERGVGRLLEFKYILGMKVRIWNDHQNRPTCSLIESASYKKVW